VIVIFEENRVNVVVEPWREVNVTICHMVHVIISQTREIISNKQMTGTLKLNIALRNILQSLDYVINQKILPTYVSLFLFY
jgi:hypothetical protein